MQGNYAEAVAHGTAAITSAQVNGRRISEILGLLTTGLAHLHCGEETAAEAAFTASERLLKYHMVFSLGMNLMGLLQHLLGDQPGAITACREALLIAEQAGDMAMVAYALTVSGHALAALGEVTEATATSSPNPWPA